jgi:hypothetical protein
MRCKFRLRLRALANISLGVARALKDPGAKRD